MPPATNLEELRDLAGRTVKYAPELYALLKSVDAMDTAPGSGTPHSISIGPPGQSTCLFRGHLNITRKKVLPGWKNAYEIALEATVEKVYGETRARDGESRGGTFVITWLANA